MEANAEWSSILPMNDGTGKAVRGLTIEEVTGPCGEIDMGKIMRELEQEARAHPGPGSDRVTQLTAPSWIRGQTDMLIGIKYQRVFPEPI